MRSSWRRFTQSADSEHEAFQRMGMIAGGVTPHREASDRNGPATMHFACGRLFGTLRGREVRSDTFVKPLSLERWEASRESNRRQPQLLFRGRTAYNRCSRTCAYRLGRSVRQLQLQPLHIRVRDGVERTQCLTVTLAACGAG